MKNIVEFLTMLYDKGLSYSGINTAKSAICAMLKLTTNEAVGENDMIKRFMKGVFNTRPTKPRYNYMWDVETVLTFLETLVPIDRIDLKNLTLKLVTLTALITGQRCQSLHLMKIDHMQEMEDRFRFIIVDNVKSSAPGRKQPVLVLPKFEENVNRCVVFTMKEYLRRTEDLRTKHSNVFISYQKPHEPVSSSTISRWIKCTLAMAGIDTSVFSAHSTRSAATSAAGRHTLPIKDIMRAASWRKESTFRKFYDKPLIEEDEFALSVLANKQ